MAGTGGHTALAKAKGSGVWAGDTVAESMGAPRIVAGARGRGRGC